MARTNTLPNFLTDVADAIREKKGTSETIQASDFDTEIANLPSGGGDISEYFNTNLLNNDFGKYNIKKLPSLTVDDKVTSLYNWFQYYTFTEIENISCNSNVTNLGNIFNNCKQLEKVSFNNFNTSNVTDMSNMFSSCQSLNNINLSGFDTQKVTNMAGMFLWCISLTSLDLSNFYTPGLTNTQRMFNNCSSLMHLDIRNMSFNNVTTYDYMFGGFNGQAYVPANCEIIVKSQTEKDWITSKFPRLTNVKTVAELGE